MQNVTGKISDMLQAAHDAAAAFIDPEVFMDSEETINYVQREIMDAFVKGLAVMLANDTDMKLADAKISVLNRIVYDDFCKEGEEHERKN